MSNKEITRYICQKCGWESPKWEGRCNQCGEWNSLVETVVSTRKLNIKNQKSKISSSLIKPLRFSEIESKAFERITTGIGELDRVLGGSPPARSAEVGARRAGEAGIVPGSVVLIAGEPGIGKSTLLTQLALQIAGSTQEVKRQDKDDLRFKNNDLRDKEKKLNIHKSVLYVCGEESPEQIKLRIERVQLANSLKLKANSLLFLPETNVENILSAISHQPSTISLVIIDSIQTLWTERLTGTAGSVGQIRECSNMLLEIAKKTNIPVFLIGHITKEGAIAGPKVLEHLVDTVLYLEGDQQHEFRILRASKNRFGPTDEVGVFIMEDSGMKEVTNPSKIFLAQSSRLKADSSGSAVVCTIQGIRPMLVEIQALVVPSQMAMPRRVASGIDFKRLQVLCAVLQKHAHIPLSSSDVFVSVAGGLTLSEPAVDLGICLAIASSFKNKPLSSKSVAIGEVGLLGEIRKVAFMEKRIKEARKLGYKLIMGEKESSLSEVIRKYLKN